VVRAIDLTLTKVALPLDQVGGLRFREQIRDLVAQGMLAHCLDLRGLTELDSLTLAALIQALRSVREAGGTVSLLVDRPQIVHILTVTGLNRVFQVHGSEAEARAAQRGHGRISA
jgi:anti-sigma B factor antagonist